MFHLKSRRKESIGLDITDVSLKLVQLSGLGSNLTLAAYSEASIPKQVLSGDAVKDPQALARIIKQAIAHPKQGRITSNQVIASIPETKSFVRVIQMPTMSAEEAVEAVPWEAETYIPLPISQVYLDWVILGEPQPGSSGAPEPGKMTVLITASPKDYVDGYVSALELAGLEPVALEVESQATARSLVPSIGSDETVLIADIDTVRTSLTVFARNILQFTSSLPIAGSAFTESIAKALNLDFRKAEKLKRKVGLDEAEAEQGKEIKKALLPVLTNLVEEIKNTIRFYEEHAGSQAKISRLLLVGGSSKLRNLPEYLFEQLNSEQGEHAIRSLPGLKVEIGNPWQKVLSPGQIPPLSREDSLSYATAIGLALREFDL